MYVSIKAKSLKMLRTLPTIWISSVNEVPHCWIPKTGYSYKLKNLVQPPNETDVKGREEWHFVECEIMFPKSFHRWNDGEMALSTLEYSYGPEWFFYDETENVLASNKAVSKSVVKLTASSSIQSVLLVTESGLSPAGGSSFNGTTTTERPTTSTTILPPDHLLNESSESSTPSEGQYVPSENELSSSQVTDNSKLPSNVPVDSPDLSDLEQYIQNKRICLLEGFEPPIHFKEFAKMEFAYVRTFNINDLKTGYKFKTLEELMLIPRKYDKPFCRPGPLERRGPYDWYLVDSIVQEVHLKTYTFPFFVVRWVGYEDVYNTVEPLENVKHTALHKLFTSRKLYTAARLNGCILRRSAKNVLHTEAVSSQVMEVKPTLFELAMKKLIYELRIEEEAGRYSPLVGFCSEQGVEKALLAQHRFFINTFCLLVNQLESPVCLDEHYIGPIFGNVGQAVDFKNVIREGGIMVVTDPGSLKDYISRGFSKNSKMPKDSPRYVSFISQRKFDTAEKHDKVQLNFHLSVFTVRSYGRLKDAIFYDPSPKYFTHKLPPVLDTLTKPVLQSFTYKFGEASEKDDCTFQCMRYIIGLATGEIPFLPNLSEPCRKIDKLMLERAAKRMKVE